MFHNLQLLTPKEVFDGFVCIGVVQSALDYLKLPDNLMSVPASSSATIYVFSNFSATKTKLRNRLENRYSYSSVLISP